MVEGLIAIALIAFGLKVFTYSRARERAEIDREVEDFLREARSL